MHHRANPAVRAAVSAVLGALSLPYKCAAYVHRRWRGRSPRHFPTLFIVSIDNLSFGGTGKTPLIMAIGRSWEERGLPYAVVSRGYGSRLEREGARVANKHTPDEVGDEAILLRSRLPGAAHYIGRDRERSLETAVHDGLRLILLDDGFQSSHIAKDFRILLLDPEQPFYYLRHFPFLARETDLLLCHRRIPDRYAGRAAGTYRFRLSGFFDAQGRPQPPPQKPLLAFSALANNHRFLLDLSPFPLAGYRPFSDHHRFRPRDLEALDARRRILGADFLLCSEKDFVKLPIQSRTQMPFLYTQNEIQCDIDVIGTLLHHAKEKGCM